MYDTIIIGAGMSGLAAGIRLAHFGRRVCLLERHHTVGGLNSFYHRHGHDYDVGLHALTNFTPKGARHGPLARLLRQLRLGWDELRLSAQLRSAVAFPGITLEFSNDFTFFESEIARHFPRQMDGFRRLVAALTEYDRLGQGERECSAREVVGQYITEPLLAEMLFCPLLFYGGAREHDMDFGQFSILFRSIFLEGFARPLGGVRWLLAKLTERFQHRGGELRLKSAVQRILSRNGQAEGVVLADGTELKTQNVVSSAGWPETLRLCGESAADLPRPAAGISIVESLCRLTVEPRDLGCRHTIVFFNDSSTFHYRRPEELADLRSGVVCSPDNFAYDLAGQALPADAAATVVPVPTAEKMIRISALANYDRWAALSPDEYRTEKRLWGERLRASAVRFVPDFRNAVLESDLFTPLTFRRFTGHEKGAIYGAVEKRYDGTTHLKNLYLCGNDQGLVGIVGTILSGIGIVNRYLLKE